MGTKLVFGWFDVYASCFGGVLPCSQSVWPGAKMLSRGKLVTWIIFKKLIGRKIRLGSWGCPPCLLQNSHQHSTVDAFVGLVFKSYGKRRRLAKPVRRPENYLPKDLLCSSLKVHNVHISKDPKYRPKVACQVSSLVPMAHIDFFIFYFYFYFLFY